MPLDHTLYHNNTTKHDAKYEALQIFVKPCAPIFAAPPKNKPLCVVDIGFNMGVACLALLHYYKDAIQQHPQGLDYVAICDNFLPIDSLVAAWRSLNIDDIYHIAHHYPEHGFTYHIISLHNGHIRLYLRAGNATKICDDMVAIGGVDIWLMHHTVSRTKAAALTNIIAKKSANYALLLTDIIDDDIQFHMRHNNFSVQITPNNTDKKYHIEARYNGHVYHDYHYQNAPYNMAHNHHQHIAIMGAGLSSYVAHKHLTMHGIDHAIYADPTMQKDTPPIAALVPHFGIGQGVLGACTQQAFHYARSYWRILQDYVIPCHHAIAYSDALRAKKIYHNFHISGLRPQWAHDNMNDQHRDIILFDSSYVKTQDVTQTLQGITLPFHAIPQHATRLNATGRGASLYSHIAHEALNITMRQYADIKPQQRKAALYHYDHSYALYHQNIITESGQYLQADDSMIFQGQRIKSHDSLPLIGPTYASNYYEDLYHDIRHGRHYKHYDLPKKPSLFSMSGFGGKGLMWTPLAGLLLATMIGGGILPISNQALKLIHPMRFTLRLLKNNNIKG